MALNNDVNANEIGPEEDPRVLKLRRNLLELKAKGLRRGMRVGEMERNSRQKMISQNPIDGSNILTLATGWCPKLAVVAVLIGMLLKAKDDNATNRCAIVNNYLVMEMSRPVTDCDICKSVDSVLVLENVTKSEFKVHAYAGRPVLVKGATRQWSALNTFSFDFFRKLYRDIPGAHQSVEEECQFFPFRTEFLSLGQVFNMSDTRANRPDNELKWYVGWSNCNPEVASVLREHYTKPNFLPDGSEASAIDWIFMGYSGQGASMHLDYVQRPSWQAQISGTKTWHLVPPPECEQVCQPLKVQVNKGDIILIDTNQWYHDTYIHDGEISITIGSEYD